MAMRNDSENDIVRDTVRSWVKKTCPRDVVRQWDGEGIIPPEVFRGFAALGFCGMLVPEEYGGQGSNVAGACIVIEELAAASPVLAVFYAGAAVCGGGIVSTLGSDKQRSEYLEKCAMGTIFFSPASDVFDVTVSGVTYTQEGDVFNLNGTAGTVPLALHASVHIIAARKEGDGAQDAVPTFFCVDAGRSGLFVVGTDALGYRGAGFGRIVLKGVRVHSCDMLGGLGQMGRAGEQGVVLCDLYALDAAAQGIGIARAALEYAVAHAKERVQFGRPIGRFPAVRGMCSRNACRVEAASLVLKKAAQLADAGERCSREAAMAKCLSHEAAREAALDCMQILGGYGYTLEYDAQRYVRDAAGLSFLGGTSDIHRERIVADMQM